MNKLLSIIIPTYNMERYLKSCLRSLLIGDKQELLEVLIINDGSKDGSLAIANEFAFLYPSVFKVIDKPNGNYGSCINRGLKDATGKYIKVLDADDSFDTKNFAEFVSFLENVDSDLVLSDYVEVDEGGNITGEHKYGFPVGVRLDIKDICTTPSFKGMQMHAVTYRRQLLVDMGYVQTEGISYTDQQWIFTPMIRVQSACQFDKPIYRYLLGRAGQTMDPGVKRKHMQHIMKCVLGMLDAYNKLSGEVDTPLKEYLNARFIPFAKEVYVTLLTDYTDESKAELIGFDNDIRRINIDFYDLIGSKEVSSFLGFRYIDYWREEHDKLSNTIVRIFSKLYLWIVLLKKRLR